MTKKLIPFPHFGRLKNTSLMLALMVVSGISEGFGIALFIPVIEQMGASESESWILSNLRQLFSIFSIDVTLLNTLLLVAVLVISAQALTYLKSRLLVRSKYESVASLRHEILENYFRADWQYISMQSHGVIINNLMFESLRYGQVLAYQIQITAAIILILLYMAVGILIAWDLLTLVFIFGAVFILVMRPLFKRAKEFGADTTQANQDFSFYALEFLKCSKLIKTISAEKNVVNRFSVVNEKLFQVSFDAENINEFTYFVFQALPVITLCAIIFIASTVFGTAPAFILTFLLVLARLLPRFTQLQQFYQQYLLRLPAMTIIDGMLTESEAQGEITSSNTIAFTSLRQSIELSNVNYSYPGNRYGALQSVNITIKHHQHVALVGVSGSGKSTLVDILVGLRQPSSGCIKIDGVDLSDIHLHSWRNSIGYVTQETTVFNDTVRNNLLFANPEATEKDIEEALRLSTFSDVVAGLNNGLETVLGENSIRLSGGQKQRLALARALIRRPELLILDEATSALDAESENKILQALNGLAHKITIFTIAHRFSTVRKADKIYVIEEGKIIESGIFEKLLADKGRFSELHESSNG
ncbi:MAG: ABC transporter ATP-binding protein [Rhodospirillales bacterium]